MISWCTAGSSAGWITAYGYYSILESSHLGGAVVVQEINPKLFFFKPSVFGVGLRGTSSNARRYTLWFHQ